jgi:hypothetical protein
MFGSKDASSKATLGANLNIDNKGLSVEMDVVKQKISKTNQKYRDEIEKYKKIADFNKKLTSSYINNINAMVDVSKLLNNYVAFFNFLKDELAKTENTIGSLTTEDIQYLESLTKAKMEEFSNRFMDQSEKIKVLYTKYNQQDEAARISSAQENIKSTMDNASATYQTLLSSTTKTSGTPSSFMGGRPSKQSSSSSSKTRRPKPSVKKA